MPRLHVVIPFYNEAGTLAQCVRRVVNAPLPDGWSRALVLVDDHSSDTQEIEWDDLFESIEASGTEARFLFHRENRGKGAALQTGFDSVLERAAEDDLVIIQDADLEYDPNDYRQLMQPIVDDDADAVFGTRWGEHFDAGGAWRKVHELGNRLLSAISNMMTGYRVTDMECCYKVFTIPVLRRLRPMLTERRFGIEPQITAALSRMNGRLVERPVQYHPRDAKSGKKIGWKDAVRAVVVMTRERWRPLTGDSAQSSGHGAQFAKETKGRDHP